MPNIYFTPLFTCLSTLTHLPKISIARTAWTDRIFDMLLYHIEYKKPNVLGGGQWSMVSAGYKKPVYRSYFRPSCVIANLLLVTSDCFSLMTILLDAIRKTGERWLMKNAIHNLGRNSVTGELCIFDNECAFFASYPLLTNRRKGGTFTSMYEELLGSVCIFRRSTVDAITKLRQMDDVGGYLYEQLRASDAMAKQMIKEVFNDHIMLSNEISNRIENVFNHMQKCLGKTGD
ncbi:putative four-jointed box protein 1 isoform X1 [Apostichopus japonicus]|uniref:Putative four-jointed box protein 1 isoform X1 n=1 Tax=Stichopus japonicus TaxID=307972 RepID=A0A2G8L1S0_STIJA|nr:putative four-jointed box protein 1 isoform X1 [Apostichopus japonicus]